MKLIKIIIPCLLLNACLFGTSKNAKFYTLMPVSNQVVSTSYKGSVGVTRLQFPKYIARPQIVTQTKDSAQVNISEYNRWVEAPDVLATRVLIEDLSKLLPGAQVQENRVKESSFETVVVVEIIQMNAVLGEQVGVSAWYTIQDRNGKIQTREKFEGSLQIGKTYDDLAKGFSQLLANLSQDIASKLAAQ